MKKKTSTLEQTKLNGKTGPQKELARVIFPKGPEGEDPYLMLSRHPQEPHPFSATFCWNLASFCRHSPSNAEEKTALVQKIFLWASTLLKAMGSARENRTLELRIQNRKARRISGIEIYLIGSVRGKTLDQAFQDGQDYWIEVASLLAIGLDFFQFKPLEGTTTLISRVFGVGWKWGRKLQNPLHLLKTKDCSEGISGFQPVVEKDRPGLVAFSRAIRIGSSRGSNLFEILFRYVHPLSLRIHFSPASLLKKEREELANLPAILAEGEVSLPGQKNLQGPQEEEILSRALALQKGKGLLIRAYLLSSQPISKIRGRLVGDCLFGEEGEGRYPPLSPKGLKILTSSRRPFFFKKRLCHLFPWNEGASLFRLPLHGETCPEIDKVRLSTLYSPSSLPKSGILIGEKKGLIKNDPIYISKNAEAKHIYILGQTGTGKSTLMLSMIVDQMEKGMGVGVIDPHGDLFQEVLGRIPEHRKEDLVVLDLADPQGVASFNPLEFNRNRPVEKSLLVDQMMEIFDNLYDLRQTGGPMFEMYMRNALLLAMEDPDRATVMDIPKILSSRSFRREKLQLCRDDLVKNFWKSEAEAAGGEISLANITPYITSKLNSFVYNHYLRPIVSKPKSSFNFRNIMDQGKIFLVNLAKGRIGTRNANLMGMFLINRIFLAALSREEIPAEKRRPFSLHIDEFQNFTTDNIAHMFAEARKFKLSLVCANQNLSQLKKEIGNAALGTVGNILCFRPGLKDVEIIEKWFQPEFRGEDLLDLPNYTLVARILLKEKPSAPFLFDTIPLPKR